MFFTYILRLTHVTRKMPGTVRKASLHKGVDFSSILLVMIEISPAFNTCPENQVTVTRVLTDSQVRYYQRLIRQQH